MNGPDLALPEHTQQMAMAQRAMEQNKMAMTMQVRTNALGMAVNLAASVSGNESIVKILTNARRMAHFLETGQVPTEAK